MENSKKVVGYIFTKEGTNEVTLIGSDRNLTVQIPASQVLQFLNNKERELMLDIMRYTKIDPVVDTDKILKAYETIRSKLKETVLTEYVIVPSPDSILSQHDSFQAFDPLVDKEQQE